MRVAIAALAMLGYVLLSGVRLDVRRHWRAYLMMGLLNAAFPWTLIAGGLTDLAATALAIRR